jgi:hypothetical protein
VVNAERMCLDEAGAGGVSWRLWGPYLGERQRGNGADIGASRQAGWTGTAALLSLLFRCVKNEGPRTGGRGAITSAAAGQRMGAVR